MEEWSLAAHGVEGTLALLVLILTFVGLWRTTKMTAFSKKVWKSTFGKTHHTLLTQATRTDEKVDAILVQLNGGGKLAVVEAAVNRIEERQEDAMALTGARLDADHQAVVITDADGKVTSVSRAFQELTGFGTDQMEGEGWINLIHPDDKEEAVISWKHAVRDGREMSIDLRYITMSGKEMLVHVKAYRQRDSQRKIRGYLAIVHPKVDHKLCPFETIPAVCDLPHPEKT